MHAMDLSLNLNMIFIRGFHLESIFQEHFNTPLIAFERSNQHMADIHARNGPFMKYRVYCVGHNPLAMVTCSQVVW